VLATLSRWRPRVQIPSGPHVGEGPASSKMRALLAVPALARRPRASARAYRPGRPASPRLARFASSCRLALPPRLGSSLPPHRSQGPQRSRRHRPHHLRLAPATDTSGRATRRPAPHGLLRGRQNGSRRDTGLPGHSGASGALHGRRGPHGPRGTAGRPASRTAGGTDRRLRADVRIDARLRAPVVKCQACVATWRPRSGNGEGAVETSDDSTRTLRARARARQQARPQECDGSH
jgi:hypothetical protein